MRDQRDHVVVDVAIVGGGPAGLALARALALQGVELVVVAARSEWYATYGVWRDDVADCDLGGEVDALVRGAWPTVRVVGKRQHLLQRPYVVFDNARLRSSLLAGVQVQHDTAVQAEHTTNTTSLQLHSGATITARLVIDATGSGELLARRTPTGGAQTAYGLLLGAGTKTGSANVARTSGVEPGVFTLMDWSTPPTFFYGAQFNDGRTLVEETSLYANPPSGLDDLRTRLAVRLGVDATEQADSVERVHIAMGGSLPARTTRVVGFGAAAGFVHPVTGYSVAASLRAATRVANEIVQQLSRGTTGTDLSLAVWGAVWPKHLVRARGWHDMGLAVLSALPPRLIGGFFDAFFELPQAQWSAYLRIDTEPAEVRAAMLGVFRRVDMATRLALVAQPAALVRALGAR
jgi:lycopene beta-cyclase